ncbi:MAG: Crp/Fnr family transcriptional regulator [Cytophagales bacterium]|nr:Crp/Fnr family transcriptional regulator [Cytophagales bacterium]
MKELTDLLSNSINSKTKSFKKGEFVQKAKDTNATSIYVKKGLLRSYIIDSSGKEYIYTFASEGWILGDLEALEFNSPVQLFIDCIEDSEVIFFNKECLFNDDLPKEKLVKNIQLLFRRIGRLQRRVLMLMGAPAEERYKYFLEIYPELPNRIPQKMIASYLGIMPQTLSKIRSNLSQSK